MSSASIDPKVKRSSLEVKVRVWVRVRICESRRGSAGLYNCTFSVVFDWMVLDVT